MYLKHYNYHSQLKLSSLSSERLSGILLEGSLFQDLQEALCCVLEQYYPLLSTGSTQEDNKTSQHDWKLLTGTKSMNTNKQTK